MDSLIDRSAAGEEIVITRDGKPVAHVVAAGRINGAAKPDRVPGSAKGVIRIAPDFDEPLDDFREYMK